MTTSSTLTRSCLPLSLLYGVCTHIQGTWECGILVPLRVLVRTRTNLRRRNLPPDHLDMGGPVRQRLRSDIKLAVDVWLRVPSYQYFFALTFRSCSQNNVLGLQLVPRRKCRPPNWSAAAATTVQLLWPEPASAKCLATATEYPSWRISDELSAYRIPTPAYGFPAACPFAVPIHWLSGSTTSTWAKSPTTGIRSSPNATATTTATAAATAAPNTFSTYWIQPNGSILPITRFNSTTEGQKGNESEYKDPKHTVVFHYGQRPGSIRDSVQIGCRR